MTFAVGDVIVIEGNSFVITTKRQAIPKEVRRDKEGRSFDEFMGLRSLRLIPVTVKP